MHWLDHYVVQNTLIMDRDHVRCQVWGSDQLPLIPCRYSRAAVADHELYTAHARGGCPGRMLLQPAGQGNKHTSYSEVRVASQLFGREVRRVALVDHRLREGCTGTASTFLCLWHECVFAFNAQLATKIICKGRARRIHFRKISTTGQGEL